MLNCAEATKRVEQLKFENVGIWKKISLQFHLAMCEACRNFQKDSAALDRMLKNHTQKAQEGFTSEELEHMKKKVI